MESRIAGRCRFTQWIHWTARIWSIASIGLVLLFVLGEGIHTAKPTEWLGLLFFPFGISVGMLVAWRREGMGGIVTVGSLLIFYGIHYATVRAFPRGWAFLVFAAPGFLFLLSWFLSQKVGAAAD